MGHALNTINKQYEQHREKSLEIDIKLPEILILATSVIIVYISTLKNINFTQITPFFIVLVLSIISLWRYRTFSEMTALSAGDMQEILGKADEGLITPEEFDKQLKEKINTFGKSGPTRGEIKTYQMLAFVSFLIGLILIIYPAIQ